MQQAATQTEPISRQNFYQRAEQFISRFGNTSNELPVIRQGTEEFRAWQQYFERHLRWTPVVMAEILDGRRKEMTVPSKFPQVFDPDFVEDPKWMSRGDKRFTDRLSHESLDELKRRYGATWGLTVVASEKRKRREWKSPTDADLYATYGRRQDGGGSSK